MLALSKEQSLKKRGRRLERGATERELTRKNILLIITLEKKNVRSELAANNTYESDNEAVIDPKLAMYRLHEGVSHASRAADVGELHRLQKSSTKPRHDGEFFYFLMGAIGKCDGPLNVRVAFQARCRASLPYLTPSTRARWTTMRG